MAFSEHLTVEYYTTFICQQSYLLLFGTHSPLIIHSLFLSRLKSFLFCKSSLPQLSFFSFRIHYMNFPDCLLLLLSISVLLLFSFFPVFTLF